MKRLLFVIISFSLLLVACDSKRDTDSLAGFWQLAEWRNADDQIVIPYTNQKIYYSFQLSILCMQNLPKGSTYYSHYEHKGDSLILKDIFVSLEGGQRDSFIVADNFSTLSNYGIPASGRFKIDQIGGGTLILKSNEGTLRFREY